MQLVAIKYDAAWVLGDGYSLHEEAENGFREVLELAPAFAEAHYNIGIALAHQSQWKEALLEFNTALRISPNFELALIARDLTQRILNGSQQSTEIKIPRYCRIFHELYELGC
ncbi:MAG: tetratricopeptide repeat protein [Arenicellales bacterium]|jgi:tetratricopeptide (TPR) repeat protein